MRRSTYRKGFTPSQTLTAVALITVFALVVAFGLTGKSRQHGRQITIRRMQTVIGGLEKHAIDNGAMFPSTEQGIKALLERPEQPPVPHRWRGPYIEDEQALNDAWGMPFRYVCPGGDGRIYDLWSSGADKAEGGEGPDADIKSWKRATMCP